MRRLWVLMAVAFVDMMGLMMVIPLLAYYAKDLGATATAVGFLYAAFPVAQLTSSPIWGRVSDRYGRRPALMIGLAASSIAYVIFGLARALPLLFLSRIAQGLGGGTTGVAQAYVADTMAPEERAKALGWLSAATSGAVLIGPGLGSLTHNLGYAAPGLFAAGLCLVNVVFAWYWLPESRVLNPGSQTASGSFVPPPQPRPIREALWDVVRHPRSPVAQLIWVYTIAMLAFNAIPTVFPLYLQDVFHVTENQIGYFFMVFGAVGVVMRTAPVGWFNARLGEARTMRVGAACMTLGLFLVPFAPTLVLFVGAQLLMPLGTALLFPANSALVSRRAEASELGQTLGVQQTFRGVASVLGPIGAGFAYQNLGRSVPFFIAAGIVAVVVYLTVHVVRSQPAAAAAA
jgi:MFS family permease